MTTEFEEHVEGARTQNLFREVNERIEELNGDRLVDGELLCECAAKDCTETVSLTLEKYEQVRRVATHFFVLVGHEVSGIERVVERNDRYMVVEKIGDAGVLAEKLDPRRRLAAEPDGTDTVS